MECITVKDVTFSYVDQEKRILDNCSFNVKEGEFVVICGESGCGKTTLLRLLKKELTKAGDLSGSIEFYKEGEKIEYLPSQIGYVMQNPDAQIVTDEVWHELAFGLENMNVKSDLIRFKVAEMAHYFGIEHWFHKKTSELSGGQKQILNLASVLVMEPNILLLDEPTAQLDPIMAAEFIQTVKKLNEQLGLTIVMVEHHLEEVLGVADRLIVLEDGKVLLDGAPREVLKDKVESLEYSVPSAVKIYHGIKRGGECPLTEKEGREYLRRLKQQGILPNHSIEEETLQAASIGEEAIRLKELYFRYDRGGEDILKGVSLTVEQGKIYSLLGGNGSGKTTLLSVLSGQKKPYSGKCFVNGKKISAYKGNSLYVDNLGYLPQNPTSLFVKNTVFEDLLEMGNVRDCTKKELEAMIYELADKLGIRHVLEKHPYDLSGGEQQRAGLAKVLLLNPQILILDEPTKGLDGTTKKSLQELLQALNDEGMTILMVTHDVEFAAAISDRLGLFFDHQIIAMDTPRNVLKNSRFFTTQASRIAREFVSDAITCEEVIWCYQN
ncbi:MAG: energy-coupling factor transporter ATPase [bacterium]|nr:energy-coupling factor transporter ATPase [bacterium]